MSFINPQEKEMHFKIAYCGPNGSGKSTNLRHIHQKTSGNSHEKIVSLSEDQGDALFFDFLPLSLGTFRGYKVRIHLYTLPDDLFYESSRKIILKGIDGLIFVADSQVEKVDANLESLKNLGKSLRRNEINFQTLPMVLQFNKRDMPNILPVEELHRLFNHRDLPEFESIAKKGIRVLECFQEMARKVLKEANT